MVILVNQALGLSLLLLVGFFGGRIASKFKLPSVSGYLIAGLLLGPSVTNIISAPLNKELDVIKVLGLGLIALVIGAELRVDALKKLGKSIALITIFQVCGALLVVFIGMKYILNLPTPLALLIAGMATATAPASPVAVIREYRARGPLTTAILAVVGLDDAVCLVLFSIIMTVVEKLVNGIQAFGVNILIVPVIELFGSILFGIVSGVFLLHIFEFLKERHQIVVISLGVILLNSGLGQAMGLSIIIVNMVTGMIVANFYKDPHVFSVLEDIELPIFVIFFTLAGASLKLGVLSVNFTIVLVLVTCRMIGKVGGAFLGALISKGEDMVRRYLGFAMFSKAGVTIGLLLLVQKTFPQFASFIIAIELGAVVICELIGPMGTKYALIASGETFEKRRN